MGQVLNSVRSLVTRIPRVLLLPLIALALGFAGYSLVQYGRFEYHYYVAGKALEREAFEESGKHLAICLRLSPDSARACFRAAQTARRSDQPEFAEEQLAACEDLGWPEEAVELERRMATFQRGDCDGLTEELLRRCVVSDLADRFLALEALARGYMRTYRLSAALACLDECLQDHPESSGARMRRGWVYERLNRPADAEADYAALAAARPDVDAAKLNLARVLREQGKTAEAARCFEELHEHAPTSAAIDLGLAQSYRGLGRIDDAWRLLSELESREPNDPALLLEKGKLCLAEGRDQEARDWLEQAVARSPQEYEPCYQLYLCLSRLGEKELAEQAERRFKEIEADLKRMGTLTESLQEKPGDIEARLQIAEIFLRRGEESEGANWLEGVVQLDPNHVEARKKLAELYERLGRPDRARLHRRALKA